MMNSANKHQARDLRLKSVQKSIEAISVFILSIYLAGMVPQLLFRFYYADQELTSQPAILEYIPIVLFVIGVGYFLSVFWGNMRREKQIKELMNTLVETNCNCDCNDCGCGDGYCGCDSCDNCTPSMMDSSDLAQALKGKVKKSGRK